MLPIPLLVARVIPATSVIFSPGVVRCFTFFEDSGLTVFFPTLSLAYIGIYLSVHVVSLSSTSPFSFLMFSTAVWPAAKPASSSCFSHQNYLLSEAFSSLTCWEKSDYPAPSFPPNLPHSCQICSYRSSPLAFSSLCPPSQSLVYASFLFQARESLESLSPAHPVSSPCFPPASAKAQGTLSPLFFLPVARPPLGTKFLASVSLTPFRRQGMTYPNDEIWKRM